MLHSRICDLFGIEHPIFSAPMGGGTAGARGEIVRQVVVEAESVRREWPGQVLR